MRRLYPQPYIILDRDTLRCSECKEALRDSNIIEQFKRHIAEKHPNPPELA